MTMSDQNQFDEAIDILRTLLKIQALSSVRDLPTKKAKILFLGEAGLSPKEIGAIVGTSAASVSQTIYAAKKQIKED